MKPSDSIKARAKERKAIAEGIAMDNRELKFKTSVRYMIENPNNQLNVEGLAMVLEEILERLDKEHKEEMHCQNCRMGISCTRCNPQEDE